MGHEALRIIPKEQVAKHCRLLIIGLKQSEVNDPLNLNSHSPSEVNRRLCLSQEMNICSERIALLDYFREHKIVWLAIGSLRAHAVPCSRILLFIAEVEFLGVDTIFRFQIHLQNHLIGMNASEHGIVGKIYGLSSEHLKFVVTRWHTVILWRTLGISCQERDTSQAEQKSRQLRSFHV